MKRELIWVFSLLLIYILSSYIPFLYCLLLLIIFVLEVSREYGMFQEITFENKVLNESTLFYYDFIGEYMNVNTLFSKVCDLMKQKNLDNNNYKLVGFYYDNPKKCKTNNRASIGLLTSRLDLEEFFLEKGMQKNTIPRTNCVYSSLPFLNILSVFLYVWRYYSKLNEIQEYMSIFRMKNEFPCIIELYQEEKIHLFIPLENGESMRVPIVGRNMNSS